MLSMYTPKFTASPNSLYSDIIVNECADVLLELAAHCHNRSTVCDFLSNDGMCRMADPTMRIRLRTAPRRAPWNRGQDIGGNKLQSKDQSQVGQIIDVL